MQTTPSVLNPDFPRAYEAQRTAKFSAYAFGAGAALMGWLRSCSVDPDLMAGVFIAAAVSLMYGFTQLKVYSEELDKKRDHLPSIEAQFHPISGCSVSSRYLAELCLGVMGTGLAYGAYRTHESNLSNLLKILAYCAVGVGILLNVTLASRIALKPTQSECESESTGNDYYPLEAKV